MDKKIIQAAIALLRLAQAEFNHGSSMNAKDHIDRAIGVLESAE
jgi:hypothetical protein